MTNVTRIFMFSSHGLVSNTRFQRLEQGSALPERLAKRQVGHVQFQSIRYKSECSDQNHALA